VNRYGNSILYRGYTSNGSPITQRYKFSPKFYLPTKEITQYRSFDGDAVKSVEFSTMRDAKDFLEKY